MRGKKVSKKFDQNYADAVSAIATTVPLVQEKLPTLDEIFDPRRSLSNTSLALSPFEVVDSNISTQSVSRGFP